MDKSMYDVEEFDDVIEKEESPDNLIGTKVVWHDDRIATVVSWNGTIALKKQLRCSRCGKRGIVVYLHGGMHKAAWCYAYSKNGKYRANLRDQDYVCRHCTTIKKY